MVTVYHGLSSPCISLFFNDTATTEIYTLSLHDALPIYDRLHRPRIDVAMHGFERRHARRDRKSTRLNSSHVKISYAVFCLKKKKKTCIWSCSVDVAILTTLATSKRAIRRVLTSMRSISC